MQQGGKGEKDGIYCACIAARHFPYIEIAARQNGM